MKIESPTNGLASKEIAELRAELRESTEKLAAISDSKAISDTKRCREDLAWIGDSTWSVEQWREEIIVKTGGLRARVAELEGALDIASELALHITQWVINPEAPPDRLTLRHWANKFHEAKRKALEGA